MATTSERPRLTCITAHPDDESFGMGGTLARYAAEGVETHVICATRGEAGRYRNGEDHPGKDAVGRIRERELRAAARELGVREVVFLGYRDGELDRADPVEASERIAAQLRRLRPHVVLSFGPDGAYGHPDHVAVSQLATAAVVRAAQPSDGSATGGSHAVSKLYYLAWPEGKWAAFQEAYKKLVSRVDGIERQAVPWADWAITTRIDTREHWPTVWRAVSRHETQIAAYARLAELPDALHEELWGSQDYYRAFSLVNGGRSIETDLFEGLRYDSAAARTPPRKQDPETTGLHRSPDPGRTADDSANGH